MEFTIYNVRTGKVLKSGAAEDDQRPDLQPGEALIEGKRLPTGSTAMPQALSDRQRIARLESRLAQFETLLIEARPDLKTRLRDLEPPVD